MGEGPLHGRVIMVTRPRERRDELVGMLRERGATAVLADVVELAPAPPGPLDRAAADLARGRFAWVVLTSAAGVEAVERGLRAARTGLSAARTRVAAIGQGTAAALRRTGIEPDLVPDPFTTEALARALPPGRGEVLLPRADIATSELEEALAAKGWTPVRVEAYRTRLVPSLPEEVLAPLRRGEVDAITFTSASTVRGLMGAAGDAVTASPGRPRIACIGPVTAAEARRAGLVVDAVARPHTIEGLVRAVERLLAPSPRATEPR